MALPRQLSMKISSFLTSRAFFTAKDFMKIMKGEMKADEVHGGSDPTSTGPPGCPFPWDEEEIIRFAKRVCVAFSPLLFSIRDLKKVVELVANDAGVVTSEI